MNRIFRDLIVFAALIGGAVSLAGCTVGKNPQHGNSIYDNPPSNSGNNGNGSSGS